MAYYIILPNGKKHTFYEGLTYDQVVAAAKNWGVDESGIQSTGDTPTATTPTTTTPTTTTPTPTAPGQWELPVAPFLDPKAADFGQARISPEQLAEYQQYMAFLQTPEGQGWPVPTDVFDFYRLIAQAEGQQIQQGEEQRRQQEEYDKYALSPEEAARRREEAYARSQYRQQEEFRESPMYSERFQQWVQGRSDMSGALQQYIEGKYPSLRAQFEAGLPRETGFETREAARAEASQRESGWQNWLSQRMPETRQEYWGQRPQERGERHYMYSPSLRAVNW